MTLALSERLSKKERLRRIAHAFSTDESMPLRKTSRNPVFGEGSLNPKIFFVGEAPGAKEDELGRPFVGAAGKFLNDLLESIGITRREVYITSILKYRPPGNRSPSSGEIRSHTPFLIEQIRILKPKLIAPLGNFAVQFILGELDSSRISKVPGISQLHGKEIEIIFEKRHIKVIPLFHPAAVFYNFRLRKILQKDFRRLSSSVNSITLI